MQGGTAAEFLQYPLNLFSKRTCLSPGTTMNESVSYEPPADVQKTGVEDAASRPRFRTFSAGALNFHSERHEPAGEKLCTDRDVAGTVVQSECKTDCSQRGH